MAINVAILSFRLGRDDGVSVVAENWRQTLDDLGCTTLTVAGDGPVDRLVPGLEIDARSAPDPDLVTRALADVDVVVVENLLTIPLNLPASLVVAGVLRGRPALLHHHDPPWQRPRFATVTDLPLDDKSWRHVTINRLTEAEFASRGFAATTIYNGFDLDPPPGDRAATREALGIGDEPVIAHPVRAIARKNIPAAIELAEQLGATYWLTGPAEEGYGPELARILARARCRVIHQPAPTRSDLFAAADLIVFPSIWEGFGNPPIEAAIHRRPVTVSTYPVAAELRALGFDWPEPTDLATLRAELAAPDHERLDHNARIASAHLGLDALAGGVEAVFLEAGWLP